jgi:lipoprotein-releasing system permease protein
MASLYKVNKMSLKISCFLAWRFIVGGYDSFRVSTVSKICFFSIFIATTCFALQIFVAQGFDKALTEKMQSIYPELLLEAPQDQSFDYAIIQKKLLTQFDKKIVVTSPCHTKKIILTAPDSQVPSAVLLKAIDPLTEPLVSCLQEKLLDNKQLVESLQDDCIIIGKELATFYGFTIGDSCTLLFTQDDELKTNTQSFQSLQVTIGAIMQTGIIQYDKYSILCSLKTMKESLEEPAITQIGVKLAHKTDEEILIKKLEKELNIEVSSWKTLYPALVSASNLEKYVMFLLLALMISIASTNIIALIVMQITQKKRDIALLKLLGMNNKTLIVLFTLMGTITVVIAGLCGIFFAILIGKILQWYPFIELPDAYFCTYLPVEIEISSIFLVLSTVIVIGTIASWFSARSVKSLKITDTLRFEG